MGGCNYVAVAVASSTISLAIPPLYLHVQIIHNLSTPESLPTTGEEDYICTYSLLWKNFFFFPSFFFEA